jgi:bacteriophage N4 adsorption protein B
MWLIDLVTIYLYCLMYVAFVLAGIILISGLDDLFIDIVYWVRRSWRAVTIYRKNPQVSVDKLYALDEKPFAIMVPAWQEHGVIDKMAELAANTLDYENYHIFVGTYPNDLQTQQDVEKVCARFPNVHKVVCARPGPTSKADCLNNVLNAILQFEQSVNLHFAGFILHDSEDVLCKQELRLFNLLVDRKDLIQLPVYPLKRSWSDLTGGHYLDEFAETHGKDLVVREALAGQMPSAGVGTCFSRRAVLKLLESGNGIAFDVQSLTEDYDIGFRLKAFGLTEVFVRFPVQDRDQEPTRRPISQAGINPREASVVSVREYFPDSLNYAVRQKSRWIIGIVYQGFKTHSWSDSGVINYFLWRDRKGVITNFTSFLAMLLALQLLVVWAYQRYVPDSYQFLSIFENDGWLAALLITNLMLMTNRVAQRVIFVTRYYGLQQGLLSIPRLLWGNLINFLANYRALKQTVMSKDIRRIAWDKTSHEFPSLGDSSKVRKPLGRILVEQLAISQEQLDSYLQQPAPGMCIGSALVHEEKITSKQLAQAVAEQGHAACEDFDAMALSSELIRLLPSKIALHYAVLPLREDGQAQDAAGGVENTKILTLASEAYIDPVSLAAIARKLGRAVNYVIVPKGQVVLGLRHWYVGHTLASQRNLLHTLVQHGQLSIAQGDSVWHSFVSKQLFLGEILKCLGHIENAALSALLQRREKTDLALGEFLVNQGVITQTVLNEALQLQAQLQLSVVILLRQAGLLPADEPLLKRA